MAATTLPGIAIWHSRATTAESSPPLSPTTSPRALAAVTCCRIHSAMVEAFRAIIRAQRQAGNWKLATGNSFLSHRLLRFALLDHPHKRIHQRRVELASALAIDLPDCLGDGPCRLVRTFLCQRVEDIRDGNDSAGQRNVGTTDSDIAAPVPSFVMVIGNFFGEPEDRESAPGQDPRADRRVRLDELELLGRQLAQL